MSENLAPQGEDLTEEEVLALRETATRDGVVLNQSREYSDELVLGRDVN